MELLEAMFADDFARESSTEASVRLTFPSTTASLGLAWTDGGMQASVRCDALRRGALSSLNARLAEHVARLKADAESADEPLAADVVSWVQECAELEAAGDENEEADGDEEAGEGETEETDLVRQWIWFIGFYTRSIMDEFCQCTRDNGITGFLMPGKPAVAALEGSDAAIADFLKATRTDVFRNVPPASRKMTVSLREDRDVRRVFGDFALTSFNADEGHKRKDIADLGSLRIFLDQQGLGHAFEHMFRSAV